MFYRGTTTTLGAFRLRILRIRQSPLAIRAIKSRLSLNDRKMQLSNTVDILILGAGWTSTFLIDLCRSEGVSFASTTRSGRDGTIAFVFDPESSDSTPYSSLPDAKTVLITFPITITGGSANLVKLYNETRVSNAEKSSFIQLGTSGMWGGVNRVAKKEATDKQEPAPRPANAFQWYDRKSDMIPTERSKEEDQLLKLSPGVPTTVFNLGGLWGGERLPRNWVSRVAATKEMLKSKGSLHLIHGQDIARAVLAVHADFDKAKGQRWILTDMRVYDWWDLASAWSPSGTGPQADWVRELLEEEGIRGLPRDVEQLARALDSRDFWQTFNLNPVCHIK